MPPMPPEAPRFEYLLIFFHQFCQFFPEKKWREGQGLQAGEDARPIGPCSHLPMGIAYGSFAILRAGKDLSCCGKSEIRKKLRSVQNDKNCLCRHLCPFPNAIQE
jgi:hypothetical protein